jgi:hypothetical protein
VFYAPRRPFRVSLPYGPEQRAAFAALLDQIEALHLPHIHPIRALTAEESSENRLSGLHRFVLLKRAESSIYAFARSLRSLAERVGALRAELERLAEDEAAIALWLRQRYAHEAEADEEAGSEADPIAGSASHRHSGRIRRLITQAEQAGQLRGLRSRLLDECQHDLEVLAGLQREVQAVFATDPKLDTVLAQIEQALAAGQKVLCISQFADTALAVYRRLLSNALVAQQGVGLVVSSTDDPAGPTQINGQPAAREEVLSRFAPRSWAGGPAAGRHTSGKQQSRRQLPAGQSELALLVGSDTLSVGQNLQDARVLLNLDLCWNPMQHEQRIGRIDRPRHSDDSAPLDIYYFLNLDMIEAELRLRATLEKRLAATYQDTAFDDEILPGYFEMIEQFRKWRSEQTPHARYVDEANALLEELAERSARPPEVPLPSAEAEQAALLHLQEAARLHDHAGPPAISPELLVTLGRVPLYDNQGLLRHNSPHLTLLAEVAFQAVDHTGHAIDRATFRPYVLMLHTAALAASEQPTLLLESGALLPFVDGLLAEQAGANVTLHAGQLAHLETMLCQLEEQAQHEQALQQTALLRARRYRSRLHAEEAAHPAEGAAPGGSQQQAARIEARLVSARLLL